MKAGFELFSEDGQLPNAAIVSSMRKLGANPSVKEAEQILKVRPSVRPYL